MKNLEWSDLQDKIGNGGYDGPDDAAAVSMVALVGIGEELARIAAALEILAANRR
jgi:hypothetical protein